ncbi:hypothetical protein M758_N009000 [Ceratodon purpureus]|nr:hypothetical protein M758_N009000 [Ceratodon purpureus]
MGIIVRERAQEVALMEVQKREYVCGELEPELQLPCGWEKCLDLKSGLIYFKDWNSGTLTYRDPRQAVPLSTQRIGLLSISLSAEGATSNACEAVGKRRMNPSRSLQEAPRRMTWGYSATTTTEGESSATETTTSMSMEQDQSLELSLNLPGTSSKPVVNSSQEESVCTMAKVRSALERSNWLRPARSLIPKKRASPGLETDNKLSDTLSTALSLLSSRPSSSRESNSSRLQHVDNVSSPSTSQCSSECFTSPSIMSYEGDDEEVQQQPRLRGDFSGAKSPQTQVNSNDAAGASSSNSEVMVTVGCKSCLMYVMLSKSHPSCPKCGNTDVLLEVPAPLPKKQRVTGVSSSTWSWCTA